MQVGVHAVGSALTRMNVPHNDQMSESTRQLCGSSGGVFATAIDRRCVAQSPASLLQSVHCCSEWHQAAHKTKQPTRPATPELSTQPTP